MTHTLVNPSYRPYQDIRINGEVISRGQRECESRYQAIRSVLDKFKRKFTLLDLGAGEGYFTCRIAQDYDCVVVAIERDPLIVEIVKANGLSNVIILNKSVTLDDLHELSQCEYFDVALCLNILHHFDDSQRSVDIALLLANDVVVETPSMNDVGACGQEVIPSLYSLLSKQYGKLLAHTPSHVSNTIRPMWVFYGLKNLLTKPYIDCPILDPGPTIIGSYGDHYEDDLSVSIPRKEETRRLIPGINLRTYQLMNGAYPNKHHIKDTVSKITIPGNHGDIRPWNVIIDGANAYLIDGNDDHVSYTNTDHYHLQQLIQELQ